MDRIRSVEVAVSAILEEEVQRQHQLDIRCEHVSWGKFVRLLKEMDESLDIQRKKLLYSAEEGGFESKEIEDERDFRRAIGTLDWNARQQNKQMPLMMHMMDRYGY
ncbi:hypothetical protein EG329_005005 [Mollisiaceae sp. DMI_Dod_QoI]|nr:hypothetical protein EG329_005005 [Helotiales sp. DMI_Dod_QoI]